MDGKFYRLSELIRPADGRCLVVDTSAGLSLGPLPGLEDFSQAVRPLLSVADGVVCSPGQTRRLQNRTRQEAGLLVRMDWNNTLRGPDFIIPPTTPHRVPVLTAQDALDLGAIAMVTTFMLGYPEELEGECLLSTVQLALVGNTIGLPLVVEVQTTGPRVSLPDKAIELGASYALEGGADVIAVPYPGQKSLETLGSFVSVPWLLKAGSIEEASAHLEAALAAGAAGIWLNQSIFTSADPAAALAPIRSRLHQPVAI